VVDFGYEGTGLLHIVIPSAHGRLITMSSLTYQVHCLKTILIANSWAIESQSDQKLPLYILRHREFIFAYMFKFWSAVVDILC